MWIDPGFPPALDSFLGGRPWTGPLPDGDFLRASIGDPPQNLAGVLKYHAARRLAAIDLSPLPLEIGGDILLPIAAVAQLQQTGFGPQGLSELAKACAELAAQRQVPRNLAEDALCSLAVARLPPFPAPGTEETVKILGGLTPWSALQADLQSLTAEQAQKAGEWLADRVLPAARPGRFPLRKLLLQKLVAASEFLDPLPQLAALAPLLESIANRGSTDSSITEHLADFFECYCGWLETLGPRDAHLRQIVKHLELRDAESERRREGLAAADFFLVLAKLDPAAARRAPRLHRDLLQGSRDLQRRLGI